MKKELLKQHIDAYNADTKTNPDKHAEELKERYAFVDYYKNYSRDRILKMTPEDIYEYLSPLWAMLIWGNKHYVIDKIIEENGVSKFKGNLVDLIWGDSDIAKRWDAFRGNVKGMGPAMISELLCKTHPDEFMLWNRRAYVGLNYLGVKNLPRYDYQLNGKVYKHLCDVSKEIAIELKKSGFKDTSLLAVDYFIWDQLQVEINLSAISSKRTPQEEFPPPEATKELVFIHNDIRDKIRDIGQWLGFNARIEQIVAEGSKVDAVWEATIGNMGRVIYIFEVQTKGSIDSLIVNLLKSLNNPAVQGVVAVSDNKQIETIKGHVYGVKELRDKLRYWNYEEVMRVHESLEFVNESINRLKLVPEGF